MAMLIYISNFNTLFNYSSTYHSYGFCNDNGKCSECTAGAVVCSGSLHCCRVLIINLTRGIVFFY